MTAPATAPTTAVKSNIVTNLDATPIVRPSAGSGGFGRVQRAIARITPAASAATSVLHRMVRIPSNCIVNKVAVLFDTAAGSSGFIGNIGLWYSDAQDGTSLVNVGNLTAISSSFFAYQFNMQNFYPSVTSGVFTKPSDGTTIASAINFVDLTFGNAAGALTDGQYLPSQSGLPIWQAVSNSLALQTTPVGAFTATSLNGQFTVASAGGSVYVQGQDPGGFFDVGVQLTTTGVTANQVFSMMVEITVPG
jgi:hypothetical protein